jgi:hypothetical protein
MWEVAAVPSVSVVGMVGWVLAFGVAACHHIDAGATIEGSAPSFAGAPSDGLPADRGDALQPSDPGRSPQCLTGSGRVRHPTTTCIVRACEREVDPVGVPTFDIGLPAAVREEVELKITDADGGAHTIRTSRSSLGDYLLAVQADRIASRSRGVRPFEEVRRLATSGGRAPDPVVSRPLPEPSLVFRDARGHVTRRIPLGMFKDTRRGPSNSETTSFNVAFMSQRQKAVALVTYQTTVVLPRGANTTPADEPGVASLFLRVFDASAGGRVRYTVQLDSDRIVSTVEVGATGVAAVQTDLKNDEGPQEPAVYVFDANGHRLIAIPSGLGDCVPEPPMTLASNGRYFSAVVRGLRDGRVAHAMELYDLVSEASCLVPGRYSANAVSDEGIAFVSKPGQHLTAAIPGSR